MEKSIRIFIILFSILCFTFCGTKDPETLENIRIYNADSNYTLQNIKYGADSLNKFDLYLPKGRNENTEVVLFLHSGGWVAGNKSQYSQSCKDISENGKLVVANLNYRFLSQNINIDSLLKDVEMSTDYLRKNKKMYTYRSDKFNLYGVSAGGHIALLYGHTYKPDDIKTIISICGPTNINDLYFKKVVDSAWMSPHLLPLLLGKPFVLNSVEAINCSPVSHLNNIPTLFAHGTSDEAVPYSQALMLRDSLRKKRIKHFFISVPGGSHTSLGPQAVLFKDSIDKEIIKWINMK